MSYHSNLSPSVSLDLTCVCQPQSIKSVWSRFGSGRERSPLPSPRRWLLQRLHVAHWRLSGSNEWLSSDHYLMTWNHSSGSFESQMEIINWFNLYFWFLDLLKWYAWKCDYWRKGIKREKRSKHFSWSRCSDEIK